MAINHLAAPTGNIADNVVGFARALRAAGLPVGPGAVIDAMNALQLIEIGNRGEVFTALESIFVKRHEHALIFKQAFDLFFRAAEEWKSMLDSVPLPAHARKKPPPASRRVQEAMTQPSYHEEPQAQEQDLRLSVSDKEILQKKDFAQMSAAEIAEVTRAIEKMRLPQAELETRRYRPDARGLKLDMRRTLRASLRTGGEIIDIRKLGRIEETGADCGAARYFWLDERIYPPVPAFHACHHRRPQARLGVPVRTRLTNVTRALRQRDPDEALASCSASVEDWAGGTRIATSLHTFNKLWARRVLGQGAIVLLISDGLEREADDKLAFEMDRLHRSCRRLIWLNPLLRYGGFEPKAQGIKMMLPHVDEFRPVHNLSSIEGLIRALSSPIPVHHRSLIRSVA